MFVLEYLGPLVIMLVLAMRPSFIYGKCDHHLSEQAGCVPPVFIIL